jgi:hypothetical protein
MPSRASERSTQESLVTRVKIFGFNFELLQHFEAWFERIDLWFVGLLSGSGQEYPYRYKPAGSGSAN